MANKRFSLTKEGTERLNKIMVELGFEDKNRPEALKLILAKGLIESSSEPPELTGIGDGFTIGDGVLAKDEDYSLLKHLIIERLEQTLDDQEIDKLIRRFLEHGLKIMEAEISQLSDLDNYLLFLIEKSLSY